MKINLQLVSSLTIFIVLISSSHADEQIINIDTEILLSTDDNINLAADDTDAIDDTSSLVSIGVSLGENLDKKTIVNYSSKLQYQHFQDTENLDTATLSFGASYRHKSNLGFTDPVLILHGNLHVIDSKTDIRDSMQYEFGLQFSKRHTTSFSSRLGADVRLRESDSKVYDTQQIRIFANIDLSVFGNNTFYSTYSFIVGDSVSSLDLNNASAQSLEVINLRDAEDIDLAFGPSFIAYRIDTDTHVATIGYNQVIGKRQSLDLSIRGVDSDAGSGVDYQRVMANLSYLARF